MTSRISRSSSTSGSRVTAVRLWDAESGQELACLRGHEDTVRSVAFDPSGRRFDEVRDRR